MTPNDLKELEHKLHKTGDREFDGVAKFVVGSKLPYDEFANSFVKVAFDLWQLNPNVEISDDFWKLDKDKRFFVKVYDGEVVPHDRRWTVFPTENNEKISIAYKNDPLVTLDVNVLGFGKENITAAQKSLLKLLSTADGASSLLGSVDENIRRSFLGKYPELEG